MRMHSLGLEYSLRMPRATFNAESSVAIQVFVRVITLQYVQFLFSGTPLWSAEDLQPVTPTAKLFHHLLEFTPPLRG